MLLSPIKITLYDPVTQEVKSEHEQNVITFAMLLAAVQLQEAISDIPKKKRRLWWWQEPISRDKEQIEALLELVTVFFGNQFTVEELRKGADVGEVLAVLRTITGRAGRIASANPTVPPLTR